MEEALKLLAKAGIDLEDIKRKLASGEWFIVEGDAECVLTVVESTRHVAIILFVEGDNALCLAKKTEAFKAAIGLNNDVLKRILWTEVVRVAPWFHSCIFSGLHMEVTKVSPEKPSFERRVYTNLIIEIVYQHGCIARNRLVDIIAEKTGKPRESVDRTVGKYLARLVKSGVIERRYHGVYCKPRFTEPRQPT